jgi:hypothetical protein
MPIIDAPKTQLDNTVRLFDNFYNNTMTVNASEYDIVVSYFESVCGTKNIARNFATFLFKISNITNEPILTLLDFIRGKTGLEVNALMAYYLNSVRSKTTLYGVSAIPTPNQTVQRNVVI